MIPTPGIQQQLQGTLGTQAGLEWLQPVSGGDSHGAWKVGLGGELLFIKLNHASAAAMFQAEFDSLEVLRAKTALRVPRPVCHGSDHDQAWLVMEHIELGSSGDHGALGEGLAAMHRVRGPAFGWATDNYIGATSQPNEWSGNWPQFWWAQRIGHQLSIASDRGFGARLEQPARLLTDRLPALFEAYEPAPSLLHGDLWGGNFGFDPAGQPVVFDPACYYGDRETDLAMTELFGGFDPEFSAAYGSAYPLHDGYRERKMLYQLYHVLNHLNLFGAAWLGRAESLLNTLTLEKPA